MRSKTCHARLRCRGRVHAGRELRAHPVPAATPTVDKHLWTVLDLSDLPRTVAGMSDTELREQAEAALRALVGREDARLREDQWRAIEALVAERRRALVVQRTGWGKSAVYFVATALLREGGEGPTVIVSPLLALMRDQVAAASRAGIRAVTINSANVTEWDEIHTAIAEGEVDVLLCSPERLNNPAFRAEVLPRLAAEAGLVVVDEAHCVSDWGHDFRPDYRRIRTLLADLPPGTPVLATTATANSRVSTDVAEQLGVTAMSNPEGTTTHREPGTAAQVLVLRGSLDRASLRLGVLPRADSAVRVAWLRKYLARTPGSGIVYCLTVAAAEEVAGQLPQGRSRGGCLHGPDRPGRARAARGGSARQPGQGSRGDVRARHGVRQGRSRFRRPPRRSQLADRVLPADRSRRPRRGTSRCRPRTGTGGSRDLGLLRLARLPRGGDGPRGARRARGSPGRDRLDGAAGDRDGPAALATGDDALGARRRRRGGEGARRVALHRSGVGVRRRTVRPGGRRSYGRAGSHAGVRATDAASVPTRLPEGPARRP